MSDETLYEGKPVEKTVRWKVYYDTNTQKPCGIITPQGNGVIAADPDKELPPINNKPHWIEEREAGMIILKK